MSPFDMGTSANMMLGQSIDLPGAFVDSLVFLGIFFWRFLLLRLWHVHPVHFFRVFENGFVLCSLGDLLFSHIKGTFRGDHFLSG